MQGPIITGDFENNKYGILQNISIHLEEHCIEMYPGSGMMEKCKIFLSRLLYNDIGRTNYFLPFYRSFTRSKYLF